jgi:hypothetical protein
MAYMAYMAYTIVTDPGIRYNTEAENVTIVYA